MKLILSLLLCFIGIGAVLSNSCFMNGLYGYGTNYQTLGFEVNTVQNGNVVPQSYSNSGTLLINYMAKTMFNSNFYETKSGSTFMEIYTFGQNQTQYTLIGSKCYRQSTGPFPNYLPLVPYINGNNISVGDTPVEQWQIVDPNTDYLTQKILNVNARTCAFMTSTFRNTNSNGNSLTVYTNFQQVLYDIRLPYVCYNAQQQPTNEEFKNSRLGLFF